MVDKIKHSVCEKDHRNKHFRASKDTKIYVQNICLMVIKCFKRWFSNLHEKSDASKNVLNMSFRASLHIFSNMFYMLNNRDILFSSPGILKQLIPYFSIHFFVTYSKLFLNELMPHNFFGRKPKNLIMNLLNQIQND